MVDAMGSMNSFRFNFFDLPMKRWKYWFTLVTRTKSRKGSWSSIVSKSSWVARTASLALSDSFDVVNFFIVDGSRGRSVRTVSEGLESDEDLEAKRAAKEDASRTRDASLASGQASYCVLMLS